MLVEGQRTAGAHEVVWDGSDGAGRQVASGVYVYRLVSQDGVRVRRMALVRYRSRMLSGPGDRRK